MWKYLIAECILYLSSDKFIYFFQEAKRLGPDEKLQPCPRCTGPSRVNPYDHQGFCTRISCQFNFCILCNCQTHKDKSCRLIRGSKLKSHSPESVTSMVSSLGSSSSAYKARVSSKQSKKRLKRLWIFFIHFTISAPFDVTQLRLVFFSQISENYFCPNFFSSSFFLIYICTRTSVRFIFW